MWRIERAAAADGRRKSSDDFAARVYVSFQAPENQLGLVDRLGLAWARSVYDPDVPTAALCYVWDNKTPIGTVFPSAYTKRVRMVVLESGNDHAGEWRNEDRDLGADYASAFGQPAPPISSVALMSDTDDTGAHLRAWYSDLHISPDQYSSPPPQPRPEIHP